MSSTFNWEELLREFSHKIIADLEEQEVYQAYDKWDITPEMIESKWLGFPSASEEQIVAAENRLGIKFPPSYREFLKVSNGWARCGFEMNLWSTEEVDWFVARNQDWVDAWADDDDIPDEKYFIYGDNQDCVYMRNRYLKTALEVTCRGGDGDIYLLIPEVIFPETGEWEAWHFGNKLPGAHRYRSFYELMQVAVEQGDFVR
ncbi:SMI1/KNR4 family protein [Pseudanabaena sp. 'Roaring Creek']|uniref:SMI1/KNR4 family protein n=1 Tax=Pseudanabaena sp. 'Roaring Creek' TaxID=1681830 RepID=UPI0006D7C50B|nr:SMI1/KNR4 family protein [Pseudanabaena sp. 'Roaring Creek']